TPMPGYVTGSVPRKQPPASTMAPATATSGTMPRPRRARSISPSCMSPPSIAPAPTMLDARPGALRGPDVRDRRPVGQTTGVTRGTVLLTGGAGYIGSHTAVELLTAGWDVVVIDDFSNSSPVALDRVAELSAGGGHGQLTWHRLDVADTDGVAKGLADSGAEAVVHFAGLKAVGESVAQPVRDYQGNVGGTTSLLQAMDATGVRRLVFSSSATVYGDPERIPLVETAALHATNPYGRTKLMIEEILVDLADSDDRWQLLALRYFNPVGAHP